MSRWCTRFVEADETLALGLLDNHYVCSAASSRMFHVAPALFDFRALRTRFGVFFWGGNANEILDVPVGRYVP